MLKGIDGTSACSNVLVLGGPISYAYAAYTPTDQRIICDDNINKLQTGRTEMWLRRLRISLQL